MPTLLEPLRGPRETVYADRLQVNRFNRAEFLEIFEEYIASRYERNIRRGLYGARALPNAFAIDPEKFETQEDAAYAAMLADEALMKFASKKGFDLGDRRRLQ